VIDFIVSTESSGAAISGSATAVSPSSIFVQPASARDGANSTQRDRFNIMLFLLKFSVPKIVMHSMADDIQQGKKP
jgi:hypothetical protein